MTSDKVLSVPARYVSGRSRSTWLFGGAAIAAALMGAVQWRVTASLADTVQTAKLQQVQMQVDAATIQKLRTSPIAAMTRTRPTESLLTQVEQALQLAQVDRALWTDSIPLPASREKGSDYRVHGTRLALKDVTIKELAAFNHALTQTDQALRVESLHVFGRDAGKPSFDAEMTITYQVYSPEKR